MAFRLENLKQKQTAKRCARLAFASLTALAAMIAAVDCAGAGSGRAGTSVESIQSRAAGVPVMAIVSLRNQRITVYDKDGWILRAPISSGQAGRINPGEFRSSARVSEVTLAVSGFTRIAIRRRES